jgi:cytochrome c oxidase assembly protein subunit 15
MLCIALFLAQAFLGALTVWKLLDPNIVSGHLAMALLLFSALLGLSLVARHEARSRAVAARPGGILPWFGVAVGAIWLQAVLGGMVSTNQASLVCPDWPTCNGEWFPPLTGLVGLQMAHRLGAYLLALFLAVLAWRARPAPAVRGLATALFVLVLVQGGIGVANLLLGIPVWMSALHLGNAALMLALAIVGTFRLGAMPTAVRRTAAAADEESTPVRAKRLA